MSNSAELHSYIDQLRQRLRLGAWLRGAAIFAGTALAVTVLLVLLLNHFAFPLHGVWAARITILIALGAVAAMGIALPVIRLTRLRAVAKAEAANPELEQRLTTFEERAAKGDDPFLELLAADTLRHTEDAAPTNARSRHSPLRDERRRRGLPRRAGVDDRCGSRLSGIRCIAACGPALKKMQLRLLCDFGNAGKHHRAPQQRSAYRRAHHWHAAGQGAAIRALSKCRRLGAGDHAACSRCGSRRELSICAGGPAGERGVLRGRGPAACRRITKCALSICPA